MAGAVDVVTAMFIAMLTLQVTTIVALVPLIRRVVTDDELAKRFKRHNRNKH